MLKEGVKYHKMPKKRLKSNRKFIDITFFSFCFTNINVILVKVKFFKPSQTIYLQ